MAWSKLGFDGDDQTSHTCLESKKLVFQCQGWTFFLDRCVKQLRRVSGVDGIWSAAIAAIEASSPASNLSATPRCLKRSIQQTWRTGALNSGQHQCQFTQNTTLQPRICVLEKLVQAHAFKTWCKGSLCQITIQETAWFPRPPIAPTETIESLKHIV